MLAQATYCTCGLPVVSLNPKSTIGMCPNCDTAQDVERLKDGTGKRAITVHDRRFALVWVGRVRAIFG
jgi:hypothetical protein